MQLVRRQPARAADGRGQIRQRLAAAFRQFKGDDQALGHFST
jgi:hypothetical protein